MKLINGDVLRINLDAFTKNKASCTEIDWDKVIQLCEVSPADLDKMNLTALRVLEKVKEYLKGAVDVHLVGIRNLIRNLEAVASQKEKEPEMKEEISAELYVRYKCSSCMKPELWPECKDCADICRKYKEASPRILKERGLVALGVLNEIKERAVKCDLRKGGARCGCCELVLTDLESAADLKAVQLIQEKAKAWDILIEDDPNIAKHAAPIYLAQARAELATDPAKALRQGSGQEKGEKKNG